MSKPLECEGCPLAKKGCGFIRPEGTGSSGILVLGEAAGLNEARDGLPFRPYAQAGSQLTTITKLAGLNRGELLISNTVLCQPPKDWLAGAPWEIGAIEHCKIYRDQLIRDFKPKVIVTLGEIATRTLIGWEGKKKSISYTRGYVFDTPYGLVVPSYHPAFIKRGNAKFIGICVQDFLKAQYVAKHGWNLTQPHYLTNPTIEQAIQFYERCKQNPESVIAFDIETDYTTIAEEFSYHEEIIEEAEDNPNAVDRQAEIEKAAQKIILVQFSMGPGTGIALPAIGEYWEISKNILALSNPKAGHNAWRFDIPNLERAGAIVNGTVHDTMWMFHHSQPDVSGHYNLQSVASFFNMPFPWKHLSGTDLNYYGCADVDAVQHIITQLPQQMVKKGIWDSYMRHIVELEPILRGMTRRGIPINEEKRVALDQSMEEVVSGYDQRLQDLYPSELKEAQPKNGYKRTPKDTTGMIQRNFGDEASGDIFRWCKLKPFKVSKTQVLRYVNYRGHPMQFAVKTDKETSDARALERLAKTTKDQFYRSILDFRAAQKLKSTYVDGWQPGPDGRVHPQFLYKPATGQLSSINPNAQNTPAGKGKDELKVRLAQDFRRIIEAPAGHRLIEFDYHSFHGMTMGFIAQDLDYMRLARLDMHSFLTSYMVKEPARFDWPDDQLRDYLSYIKKKYKSIRDTQAKPAILGAQFGLGAASMAKYNWEYMTESDAAKMLALLDDLFPKVKAFKNKIVLQAHRQKYLISPFGYIRWFWDAMRWDQKRGCFIKSEQAEQAMAFLPANSAFGHKKEAMRDIFTLGWDDLYGLVNEIHDSLFFVCPEKHVEKCIEGIKSIMESPSKVLVDPFVAPHGLAVEVDVKVGTNWSKMEELQ